MQSKKAGKRSKKKDKPAPASPRPASRSVRLGVVVVILLALALGGCWWWISSQDRALYEAAIKAAKQGPFRETEPYLRQAYQRHPDDVVLTRALGLGHLAARHFDDAEFFLNRWCELSPGDTEPLMNRIELWKSWQKPAKAVADAQSVLAIHPGDSRGRLFLAQMLSFDARFDDAEREALPCLQAQPDNVEIWYLLATIYQRQGRIKEAADLTDRLLAKLPDSVPTLVLRADLHLEAGQVEPAIQLLTRAASSSSLDRSFDTFQLNGQAFPNPLAAAERMLDRSFVLYQLSQAFARAGRDQEAKKALNEMQWRRTLLIWSEDPQRDANTALQGRVVEAYVAAGKLEEAISFLTEILGRHPSLTGTRLLLADCYDKQGQTERAAEQRRLGGQGR